ncbi:MAG: hypothetical protein ACFFAY_15630 [Promethearchaeota archaeon]
MSDSTTLGKIVKDLDGAKKILDDLKKRVTHLRHGLDPIERILRVRNLSDASSIIKGIPGVYVIMPTALCPGDPLGETVTNMNIDENQIPNLIKLEDSSESEETCRSLNRAIEAEKLRLEKEGVQRPRALLILRWSDFSAQIDKGPAAIIGKRYYVAASKQLREFEKTLENCGIAVYKDIGEFGGGPISYHLTRYFSSLQDMFVIQITISRTMAVDVSLIQKILKCLGSI